MGDIPHPNQGNPHPQFSNGYIGGLGNLQLNTYLNLLQSAVDQDPDAMPSFFADTTIPVTLLVPNDDAFTRADQTTRGYNFSTSDMSFVRALLQYHATLGTWQVPDVSPFNTIIPTVLSGQGYVNLENNNPQIVVLQTNGSRDTKADLITSVLYQKNSPTVVNTATFDKVTVHVIDQVLGIPGQYGYEASNNGLGQFEQLRTAAGIDTLENEVGFTVFAPAEDEYFFKEAQSRFSSTTQLSSLFYNHVIYGQTIYSSSFTNGTYTSKSGYNYTFYNTAQGGYTISLNGITTNVNTTDIPVSNGVIHLLNDALWNLSPQDPSSSILGAATSASSTSGSTSTPAIAPPSTAPSSTEGHSTSNSSLSVGIIAAIVVASVAVLILLAAATFYSRRYYHALGARVLMRRDESLDGHVTPTAMRTSPFQSRVDLMGPGEGYEAVPTHSRNNSGFAYLEKHALGYRPEAISRDASYGRASATSPTHSTAPSSAPFTEEVMEHLLQTLAQRIDRNPPSQPDDRLASPPEYRPAA